MKPSQFFKSALYTSSQMSPLFPHVDHLISPQIMSIPKVFYNLSYWFFFRGGLVLLRFVFRDIASLISTQLHRHHVFKKLSTDFQVFREALVTKPHRQDFLNDLLSFLATCSILVKLRGSNLFAKAQLSFIEEM